MKQICTLKVLLVALWCLSVSVKSYAEVYSGSCGESVNWSLDTQTGLLEITGSGEMEDYDYDIDTPWFLHRPSINKCTIENGVTSIGGCAFLGCTGLTSITIPNSVTSMGWEAFAYCFRLTSITIPNSVTSIGDEAFYNCTGLTSITIPNSVTSIGDEAFYKCTGLTSITIPNSVTSMGWEAFSCCTGLTSITIGNSVTSIRDEAFYKCTGLTSITIGNSVTSIGKYAFYGCSQLKTVINLSNLNITEGSVGNGYVAYYADKVIKADTQIDDFFFEDRTDGNFLIYYIGNETELTLPENYQGGSYGIGDYAFEGCFRLTSITIPNSVTSIGDYAFKGCFRLTSITIPNSVTSIGDYAFWKCSGLTDVIMGEGVTSIGTRAFGNNSNLVSITCYSQTSPEAVLTGDVFERTFYDISKEAILYYPKGSDYSAWAPYFAQMIEMEEYSGQCGENAYWELDMETGVLSITGSGDMYDFSSGAPWYEYKDSIKQCTMEEGITRIGNYAFKECTKLTNFTIPEGVTSIGEYAFQYCSQLKTVINCSKLNITKWSVDNGYVAYYADKVIKADTQIDDFFFEDRTDGNYLVCYIGNEAELTLPENYQGGGYNVGEGVFSNYSKLTSITIPESVTSIGDGAFNRCTGLTSITIPNSATSIGGAAFLGCTGLTSITIGNSVTSIGNHTFYGCTGLTSITIPNSVTSIGDFAFEGCTGLTSITIPESVTSIGNSAFRNCTGLTSITIPESVTSIGDYAFAGCTNIKTIYCRSQEPPICGNSALDGIDTWDCTLFVPEGAEALYKAADQWKDFFFIEEITGIDTPRADDGKDTTYDIYDMSGRMVRKAATTTDGLKPGLYIINGRKVLVE